MGLVNASAQGRDPSLRLLLGLPGPANVSVATLVVSSSVPEVNLSRIFRKGLKSTSVPFKRLVVRQDSDNSHVRTLALLDVSRDPAYQGRIWTHWQLRVAELNLEPFSDQFPDASSVVAIDLWSASLQRGCLEGAEQLALARHLLVRNYRRLYPDLSMSGVAPPWDPSWWPDPPPSS